MLLQCNAQRLLVKDRSLYLSVLSGQRGPIANNKNASVLQSLLYYTPFSEKSFKKMSEPIYNTRSLFSSYYLEKVVAEQTDASLTAVYQEIQALYVSIAAAASRLNEAQTEEQFIRPVLRVLGARL